MRLITSIAEMQSFRSEVRARGKSVALVPTMGSLHEGHFNLVRQAKRQCDAVVVSIFVNPKQFDRPDDLARYPRDLEKDLELLRPFTIDAAFAPAASEIYPEGFATAVEPGEIATPFEGTSRLGHFRGVATIVLKLLNIVRPDVAYFGQKDFQQAMVIRRLVDDLNLEVRLVICPTVRDPDGVAASSRNACLSPEGRKAASVLYRSLRRAEELVHSGETDTGKILSEMQAMFAQEPQVELEYAAIVEPVRLRPVQCVTAGCVALVAGRVGPARLIDNTVFGPMDATPEMLLQLALTARPVMDVRARIPGFEAEAVRLKIMNCRDCAAIATIQLPPREFLSNYVKIYYPDLNVPRVAVIGRDAPSTSGNFLYRHPEATNRFVTGLYELLGVKNFQEFRARFVLTDAIRCHSSAPRVGEKALGYCTRHLRAELSLFPNLETLVVLGDDAYFQIQWHLLNRPPREVKPFNELLNPEGWAREEARVPSLSERLMKIFYCHHPTFGYKRTASIAAQLA